MFRILLSSAILLAMSGVASAQSPIQKTLPAAADARVEISNIKGSITVSGWDQPTLSVTGTLGKGAKGLEVSGDAKHLTIKVEPPERGWFNWGSDTQMGDTTLDIKVPRDAELKIETVSADVNLGGVAGRSLSVDSVSGKLRLDSAARELEIDSVSGNIDISAKASRSHIETVSGNIRARGLGGEIRLETVSGSIDADSIDYHALDAGSVSGDLNLRGTPSTDVRVAVETMSGDVHLRLPEALQARLNVTSFSGSINSDFGQVDESGHGPGSRLETTLGDGHAQIKVETFSGDIEIRKP